MRRVVHPLVLALALSASACTITTNLDGLSGGATDGDAATVSPHTDGGAADARVTAEGGEAGPMGSACGFPGPTTGLIAYYPFEEGSGNMVHDCGPHHLDGGFIAGSAGNWTAGEKGGGISVAAPHGCVGFGMPAAVQSVTLSASLWIKLAAYPAAMNNGYFIGQTADASVSGWRFGIGSSGLFGWESSGGGKTYRVDSTAPIPLNAWHHVAATFAPNDKTEIFFDGVSAGMSSSIPAIDFAAVAMRIGCRADNSFYLNGAIDEVRLYDRVLTRDEITSLATP